MRNRLAYFDYSSNDNGEVITPRQAGIDADHLIVYAESFGTRSQLPSSGPREILPRSAADLIWGGIAHSVRV